MTTRTLGLGMLIALGCAADPTLFGATAEGTAGGSGGGEGVDATDSATSSDETTGAVACVDDCAGEVLWTRELEGFPYDIAIEADGTPVLVLGAARVVRHHPADGTPVVEFVLEESGALEAVAVGGPTVVSSNVPGDVTELRRVGAQGLGAVWARSGDHDGQETNARIISGLDGWTQVAATEHGAGDGDRVWVDVFAPDGTLSSTWTRDLDVGSIDAGVDLVGSRGGGAFDVVVSTVDGTGAESATLIRVTTQGAEGASVTLDSPVRAVLPRGEGFTVMGFAEGSVSLGELDAALELAAPTVVDPLPDDAWPLSAAAIPDGTLVATMQLGLPLSLELRRYDTTGALAGITTVAPVSPTSSPTWAQLAARGDAVYMLGEDSDGDTSLGWLRRIAL